MEPVHSGHTAGPSCVNPVQNDLHKGSRLSQSVELSSLYVRARYGTGDARASISRTSPAALTHCPTSHPVKQEAESWEKGAP